MGSRTVSRFRRELSAGVKSGKNAIGIDQAIDAVATPRDLLACLDVWCVYYDPADWPVERQKKHRAQFEAARTAGYLLFNRAIEIATPANGLAELLQSMGRLVSAQARKGAKEERHVAYARRYASLDDDSRRALERELSSHLKERARDTGRKRLLIDSLAEAYRKRHGVAHRSIDDLLALRFEDPRSRRRFEQLAGACEHAWTTTSRSTPRTVAVHEMVAALAAGAVAPTGDATTTGGKIDAIARAFRMFAEWVAEEMRVPLDFFRLASWVREGAQSRNKDWDNVWQELYLEVVARGQNRALADWHIQPMRKDRRFVGRDAELVARPLDEHARRLLWNRLKLAQSSWQKFAAANLGRRRAHIIGQQSGLILLDEVQAVAALRQAQAGWEKDPVGAAKRWVEGKVNQRPQRWWINQTIEDAFTALWIEADRGVGRSAGFVLVELHAAPGFVFKSSRPFSGLSKLHQDAFYRQIARDAQIAAAGALALLKLAGYAFDLATAVAGGGGIRLILFRFAMEVLKDEATNAALDAAGIENPWVRTAVGMGVNLASPKIGALRVKGVEEIDLDTARKAGGAQVAAAERADAVADPLAAGAPRRGEVAARPKAATDPADAARVRQLAVEARMRTAAQAKNDEVGPTVSLPATAAMNDEAVVQRLRTGTDDLPVIAPSRGVGGTATFVPSATRDPVRPNDRFVKRTDAVKGRMSSSASASGRPSRDTGGRAGRPTPPPRGGQESALAPPPPANDVAVSRRRPQPPPVTPTPVRRLPPEDARDFLLRNIDSPAYSREIRAAIRELLAHHSPRGLRKRVEHIDRMIRDHNARRANRAIGAPSADQGPFLRSQRSASSEGGLFAYSVNDNELLSVAGRTRAGRQVEFDSVSFPTRSVVETKMTIAGRKDYELLDQMRRQTQFMKDWKLGVVVWEIYDESDVEAHVQRLVRIGRQLNEESRDLGSRLRIRNPTTEYDLVPEEFRWPPE